MADDADRGVSILNRWNDVRAAISSGRQVRGRRPKFTAEESSLPLAEDYRLQVVREVTGKITEIQNHNMREDKIRKLNDEINEGMREKERWETRILELGGPHHKTQGGGFGYSGYELKGHPGYRYYGAALNMPGVRELFDRQRNRKARPRTREELIEELSPEYFGWAARDPSAASIIREAELEQSLIKEALDSK